MLILITIFIYVAKKRMPCYLEKIDEEKILINGGRSKKRGFNKKGGLLINLNGR